MKKSNKSCANMSWTRLTPGFASETPNSDSSLSLVAVNIVPDTYPDDLMWKVWDATSEDVVLAGSTLQVSAWLPPGNYKFEAIDGESNGQQPWAIAVDHEIIRTGQVHQSSSGIISFSVGQQATTEPPSMSPSLRPSQSPSKEPSSTPSSSISPSRSLQPSISQRPSLAPVDNDYLSKVDIVIVSDNYPQETSWTLHSYDGDLSLIAGGSESESLELEPGHYTFQVFDSYGDGMCCQYGNGNFSLQVNDEVIFTGGEFGASTGELWFVLNEVGQATTVSQPTKSPTPSPTRSPHRNGPPTFVIGLQPSCSWPDSSKFNICLDIAAQDQVKEDWLQSFSIAVERWEEVIVGDNGFAPNLNGLSASQIATILPDQVDDLYIAVQAKNIDGLHGILGMAGPTRAQFHNGKWIPVSGVMEFDIIDINQNIETGIFEGTVLHEIGHVLGLGPMWAANELFDGSTYSGQAANIAFEQLSGLPGPVPIESHGGQGTAGGHWSEACMPRELMTGYINHDMKLSAITLGGLEDLGYSVDYSKADAFGSTEFVDCVPSTSRRLRAESNMEKRQQNTEGVRQLTGKSPRLLSDDGKQKAVEYGKDKIAERKESIDSGVLPPDVMDLFELSVLYMEGDSVFEVEVRDD